MAARTYLLKTSVDAEQFLVGTLPWPTGVVAVQGGTGYMACYPDQELYFQIAPGDYIVSTSAGPKVVAQAEFESQYQV